MAAQRVLVVDDEPTVRDVVARYLEREGYVVREVGDGDEVAAAVESFRPDLVVLDVMLPGRSGLEVLRDLDNRVPVILLTARTDETDRVLGLELGADDYVVKPFSPRELVARVRSVLRRSGAPTGTAVLTFDDLSIDLAAREVRVSGEVIALTAKEFDVLAHLASHPRQVFSRAQLLVAVWDSSPDYQDPATVTVHVRRVRNKIERDPEQPRWIATVWGVGYRFEP
jgi:DNA-binding response OmpR family regulator